MKKILAILLTAALMVPCFAVTSQAASITEGYINSLSFQIDMSSLAAGSEPSEYDQHNIPVKGVMSDFNWEAGSTSGTGKTGTAYEGCTISITDLQCISTNNSFKVGDTARFKFWVSINGTNKSGKDFKVTSSTAVHVKAATGTTPAVKSVSKTRSGSYELAVTVTSSYLKGQYSEPQNLTWTANSLGQAQWTAPEDGNNAGVYDVRLSRDGRTVYTQSAYQATSINLYPWMTREGDYTFLVRSVTNSSGNGAKNSEWVESDGQEITKDKVSDGSGQGSGGSGGTTSGKVGWQQVNGKWYFFYPDGSMKKNGWEKISNKWYLFDANGMMLTGWQTHNNNTFYLDTSKGDMKTGWVNTSDGQWYWLNPNPQAGTEGAMLKNQFLDKDGYRYYLTSTGAMATGWTKINNEQYYFRPNNDGRPKGSMVTNQRVDGFWLGPDGKWVKGQ